MGTRDTELEVLEKKLEKRLQDPKTEPLVSLPLYFLKDITSGFSTEQELGRGAYGVVYKGVLRSSKAIAVKKIRDEHLLGNQVENEIICLTEVSHQNVAQLVGYCVEAKSEVMEHSGKRVMVEKRVCLLCFEFLCDGSLDKHLSDDTSVLDWDKRYKIIRGICRGLHYLHDECRIVHLDLKPQNILMDVTGMPKIADFGLSRLLGEQKSKIVTENRAGTLGYMAQEYLDHGIISSKADIFSLGVIIIEIITGSRDYPNIGNSTETSLKHYTDEVVGSWRNRLVEITPTHMSPEMLIQQVQQCISIALKCLAESNKRPTSLDIVQSLNAVEPKFTSPGNPPSVIEKLYCINCIDAISEKVDSWRKGKSEVIDINHILILGWSDKLGSLLKQLAIANKSIGGGVVAVLAEREKEEMEMDIANLEVDFMGTSVICRSGSPLIPADLKKVSVSEARAIIVLASDENADQSDARALRVVLGLTGVKEGLRGHIVVEMSDLENEPLVKLVGGELIETVVAHGVIGRLMIQCALQPGLAQIWEDILGFENAEFYIKRWPELDGMRFGDVLISFPDAVPCGVKVASKSGKILMNPDDDYVLSEGDEVLVIAEDGDTYAPAPLPEVNKGSLPNILTPPKYPEKILFCGWRRDIHDMIMVLEAFLAPGSELWMFNEVREKEREIKLTDGGLDIRGLTNIKLVHIEGNAVIRRHLERLPLEAFDSILILADEYSIVHSDSRSLATLLLIRDIQSKRLPYKELKSQNGFRHSAWIREMQHASDKSIIISEILDSRTRNLVSVSKISDYVLSNELVSMALAMVAEDKQINRVLEELFAYEGNEMCIRSAEFYLYEQEELSFFDIMVRARERDEIVIGYRIANTDQAIINPEHKSEIRKWSLDDVFVVIYKGD